MCISISHQLCWLSSLYVSAFLTSNSYTHSVRFKPEAIYNMSFLTLLLVQAFPFGPLLFGGTYAPLATYFFGFPTIHRCTTTCRQRTASCFASGRSTHEPIQTHPDGLIPCTDKPLYYCFARLNHFRWKLLPFSYDADPTR